MIFFAFFLFQQLFSIQGTVRSIHFDKLDDLHVSISSSNPKGKFDTKLPNISVSENSNFQVQIFEPGLYSLYTRAPYHEGSLLSFLVDRPDSIIVDIKMNANAVEDGEFFPDPEYVKWIDVLGNFNDWDSETAIPFTFDVADSNIYCVIPSNLDTVWYRINGLNAMVLPRANAYKIMRVQGREGYVAALIPENGEVVLRYHPGEYPFPKPKGYRYERSLYYQPEKWIPTYFSFKEKIHEEAVIQLLKTSQLHSGFSRVSDSRYLVQGPFTRFDTVLDSVFQSVKTLPKPAQQSTKQRLQSFLYVRAVMQRLSAELTLKDKAGGIPIIQRKEMWDAFLNTFASFPPLYPLWTRISSEKHTLAYLLIKVPHLKPHIEDIALQQPDRIYSLELFFEVGEALIKMGEHTSAHDWLTLMEERHSTSQKTQDLRDLISVK